MVDGGQGVRLASSGIHVVIQVRYGNLGGLEKLGEEPGACSARGDQ